jgi:hypothetical protein
MLAGLLLSCILCTDELFSAENFEPADASGLTVIELRFESPQWAEQMLRRRDSGVLLPSMARIDPVDFPHAGVRFHGRSSLSVHRVSKKVPFWIDIDTFDSGQKWRGRRTLVLKNHFADPSLLRESLALKVIGDYLPAPRASFVRLTINNEDWGPYTLVELPDHEFFERWFEDPSGPIHIGEYPFTVASLANRDCTAVFPAVNTDGEESCEALRHLLEVMDGTDQGLRLRTLPDLLDVDQALRHLAVETAIGHTDGFPANNYTLYRDPASGRFTTIPWDYNQSFDFPELGLLPSGRGLLAEPSWYARYRAYVRTIIEVGLDWVRLEPWLREQRQLIDTAARNDDKSLYPYDLFVRNWKETVTVPNTRFSRVGLKEFIDRRHRWLEHSGLMDFPRARLEHDGPRPGSRAGTFCLSVRADGTSIESMIAHIESGHEYGEMAMLDDGEDCDPVIGDGEFAVAVDDPESGQDLSYYFTMLPEQGELGLLPATGGFKPFRLTGSPMK